MEGIDLRMMGMFCEHRTQLAVEEVAEDKAEYSYHQEKLSQREA